MAEADQVPLKDMLKKIKNKKILKLYKDYPNLYSQVVLENYIKLGEQDLEDVKDSELFFRENLKCLDKNIYTGQVDDRNRRHGLGILLYEDKSLYYGYFKSSFCKGYGRLFMSSGTVYEGKWKAKYLRGVGKIFYDDKRVYSGELTCNIPHGKGELELPGKFKYIGGFLEGLRHGKGKMVFDHEKSYYHGDFFKDKFEGKGILHLADGTHYEGQMAKSKMHGKGLLTFRTNYEYDGEFIDGMKDGYGVITYENKSKFIGYWRNDKPDGKGVEIKSDGLVVEGLWRNGALVECYNDAFDDVADIYPFYHKKDLAENLNELLDKVQASRAGNVASVYDREDEEEDCEPPEPVKIEPFSEKMDESEKVASFYELSKIVVSHSLYTVSKTKFEELPKFQYDDKDHEKKNVGYKNEWVPVGNEGGVYKGEKDKRENIHGRGVLLEKGRIYQGYFEQNKKVGLGREIYPNGIVYEGYWWNSLKHGFGVESSQQGQYTGDWVKGKKSGLGIMITKEWRYEGLWENDLQQGQGQIKYRDKSRYKGEFHMGFPEGYGCFVDKSGKAKVGLWEKGQLFTTEKREKTDKSQAFSDRTEDYSIPFEKSLSSMISEDVPSSVAPGEISKSSESRGVILNEFSIEIDSGIKRNFDNAKKLPEAKKVEIKEKKKEYNRKNTVPAHKLEISSVRSSNEIIDITVPLEKDYD